MLPKVTFLTRYYPPSPNINGESVCDMVDYLQKEYNISSNIICTDRYFAGGGQSREPKGNVIRIKTLFKNEGAFFRFFTFLYDGYVMVRQALKHQDTLIVVTTSPPLLPFWASILLKKKVHWGLWTLDLFPEGFSATGKISKNNLLFKWVKKKTYQNKPNFLITLGPKQHQHLEDEYGSSIDSAILPCGVFFHQDKSSEIPEWKEKGYIYFGYCGNIGDAHNPTFLKSFIDQIDDKRHKLVLALYGVHAPEIKAYAKDKPGVILVDSVPRNQLHFIDIHLVTLKSKWTHIAVPSKAVSAVSLGGAIIFCGHKDSDNWHMFEKNGWIIDESKNIPKQISAILNSLTPEALKAKKEASADSYTYLKNCVLESYASIAKRLKSI